MFGSASWCITTLQVSACHIDISFLPALRHSPRQSVSVSCYRGRSHPACPRRRSAWAACPACCPASSRNLSTRSHAYTCWWWDSYPPAQCCWPTDQLVCRRSSVHQSSTVRQRSASWGLARIRSDIYGRRQLAGNGVQPDATCPSAAAACRAAAGKQHAVAARGRCGMQGCVLGRCHR